MEDESRHVAFGVLSLREFCLDLSEKDRNEREEFVYEACVLMRDRIDNREVWERMGLDADECIAHADESELAKQYRYRLFSKIVPNVKSLGLLSDKQRARFEQLGILEFENNTIPTSTMTWRSSAACARARSRSAARRRRRSFNASRQSART